MRYRRKTIGLFVAGCTALTAAGATAVGHAAADEAGAERANGPASAASSAAAGSSAAASAKVMTWNVCANSTPREDGNGNALCANGRQTNKVAAGIRWHMNRHEGLNAVLLQEICYADLEKLRTLEGMDDWSFGFSGILDRGSGSSKGGSIGKRQCAEGRGQFGVVVGVKTKDVSFARYHYATKNVPNARDYWGHWNVHQPAVCADALGARFCGTHFTPFKGGHQDWDENQASEFLTSQYGQAQELAGWGKDATNVVLGGDLNAAPKRSTRLTGPMLDPLYTSYKECSQDALGGERTGAPTFQRDNGNRDEKLDYLFTGGGATASCDVTDQHVTLSDHVPVTATITF